MIILLSTIINCNILGLDTFSIKLNFILFFHRYVTEQQYNNNYYYYHWTY